MTPGQVWEGEVKGEGDKVGVKSLWPTSLGLD